MNEARISVASEGGSDVSGRALGRKLRGRVSDEADRGRRVVVDFSGVKCASDSFLDEFIAVLVATRGKDWFRSNVSVVGLEELIRRDLLEAIRCRISEQRRRARDSVPA